MLRAAVFCPCICPGGRRTSETILLRVYHCPQDTALQGPGCTGPSLQRGLVQGVRMWDANKCAGSQRESLPPTGSRTYLSLSQGELWAPQGHCLCSNTLATGNHEDKTAPHKVPFNSCPSSLGWGSKQSENQNRTDTETIFRARAQYI